MSGRIYRRFFTLSIALALVPALLYAQASKIAFITDPQSAKPSELSGIITFQLQDGAGNAYKADETVDVEFSSTSASGEFLSPSSENPVTKTISTGNANKNFRYRDSASGNFTITVKATGRTSGAKWSKTQSITISSSASSATVSSQNSSSNKEGSSDESSSVHYSASQTTSLKRDADFKVGAGRDRTGIVGSPLEFVAETDMSYTSNSIFVWNFGDGSEKVGQALDHTYQYPGEYAVVLNVAKGNVKAVSRISVNILPAELSISAASPERVEVYNNSSSEAPLFGRALVSSSKVFVFPKDSIIKGKQKISFSAETTGLAPRNLAEVGMMVVGTETSSEKIAAKMAKQADEKIVSIQREIESLKQKLAASAPRESQPAALISAPLIQPEQAEVISKPEEITPQTASAVASVSESKTGWFARFKKFFLRTQ